MSRTILPAAAAAAAALLALLAACAAERPAATLRLEGRQVFLEADRPLRGLQVDLEWDPTLTVTAIEAGPDAERLNLVRVDVAMAAPRARVVITDTRRLRLPVRGAILRIDAEGEGAVRLVGALGAGDGPAPLEVELR